MKEYKIPAKVRILLVCIGVLLIAAGIVRAGEPSQQFNKILLDPFYRISMNQDTDYKYTLEVYPPDGISVVSSAIITFQLWLNPTVTFDISVNGTACNTASYQVHTTYANAGEGTIFFDCSNTIVDEGTYMVTLTPDDDTGAVTSWVDITYMNSPPGEMEVYGTEYRPGENGTVWLQLFDEYGNTVDTGACEVTIYYPDKTKWYDGVDMTHLENGVYYKDVFIPSIPGVYMETVYCYYEQEAMIDIGVDKNVSYSGLIKDNTNPNPASVLYSDCTFVYTKDSNYQEFYFNDSFLSNVNISTITSIDMNWIGQNEKDNTRLQAYNANTATWVTIGNVFGQSHGHDTHCDNSQGVSRSITSGFSDYIVGGVFRFRVYHPTEFKEIATDDVSISIHTNSGFVADLRGSGELHVNDWFGNFTGDISAEVWNYPNRNLTYFPLAPNIDDLNALANVTASDVWSFPNRTLTSFGTLVADIWAYVTRTLTAFSFDVVDEELLAENVWNYSFRNLTYFPGETDLSSLSNLTAAQVWAFADRNLTYFPPEADLASMANLTSAEVWDYFNRTLTFYDVTDLSSLANLTADDVWDYNNRTLTYYEVTDITSLANLTSDEVWNYFNRTLTEIDVFLDLTSLANLTAGEVWSYPVRNLTYYEVTAGLSAEEVWNYTGRYTHGILLS